MNLNKILEKNYLYIITFLFLVGAYLRSIYLNDGIWPDEWISFYISVSELNFFEKLDLHLKFEGAPPINLFFLNLIYILFGDSYQNFEICFLILNLLSVLIFLKITSNFKQKLILAFLLCLNSMLIYYSGEIRFYSLSLFFTVLSIIYFFKVQNNQLKINVILFIFFTLISLLINVYSISLIFAYSISNFFFKKLKLTYISLSIIFILFVVLNLNYLLSINEIYFSSGAKGNIDIKFFLGYFFNIYFGNILLGVYCLILLISSVFYFGTKILKKEKLFLFYNIILITYLIPIFLIIIGKNITSPRHFIFLIPSIVYILSFFLISLNNINIKLTSILILVFLNVYANFFSQKPFMVKKPNPNAVLDIFNNQINKKIFLHGIDEKINNSDVIKKKKVFCRINCSYESLVFLYSSSFDIMQTEIILNNDYLKENEFWTICLHLPSYRGDKTKENELKNCYRRLDFLENTHYQAENYIENEFKLTLYKSR